MKRKTSVRNPTTHWLAKLSPEQVQTIRQLSLKGMTQHAIRKEIRKQGGPKVSQATISKILRGQIYRNVA